MTDPFELECLDRVLARYAPAGGTVYGVPIADLNADQLRRVMTLMQEDSGVEREVDRMHEAFMARVNRSRLAAAL